MGQEYLVRIEGFDSLNFQPVDLGGYLLESELKLSSLFEQWKLFEG